MNELTHSQLKALLQADTPPCLSIYVPLSTADLSEQGLLAGDYGDLLKSAHSLLLKNYSERVVNRILAPLKDFKLPERLRDKKLGGTLAIFKSPTFEGCLHLSEEHPSIAVVADSFHIKPIFGLLLPPPNFYVLDVQSRHATLYKGDQNALEIIQNYQSNDSVSSDFLTRLESEVTAHMMYTLGSSLFVVGKRHCTNQYMRLNHYGSLHSNPIWAAEGRERNETLVRAIHAAALKYQQKLLKRDKDKSLIALRKARRRGLLEQDLGAVVRALTQDQVKTLYVRRDALVWGTIDWRSGRFSVHPTQTNAHDDDIVDDCLEKALGSAGIKVVCLDQGDLGAEEFVGPVTAILNTPYPRLADTVAQNPLSVTKLIPRIAPSVF